MGDLRMKISPPAAVKTFLFRPLLLNSRKELLKTQVELCEPAHKIINMFYEF